MGTSVIENPFNPGHITKEPEHIDFPVDLLIAHGTPGSPFGEYSTVPTIPETSTHRWSMAWIGTTCYMIDPLVPIIWVQVNETYGIAIRKAGGGTGSGDNQPNDESWYEWFDGVRFSCTSDYSSGWQTTVCTPDPEYD
jgi:hypothetical protein